MFEYQAFQDILDKLALRFGKYRFGFPLIGMGLAGGNPELILASLDQFAQNVASQGGSVTVVEYDSGKV